MLVKDEYGVVRMHLDGLVRVKEYEFTKEKGYDEGYCIYNEKGEHFVFCFEVERGGNPFFTMYEVGGELEDFISETGCDIVVNTFGWYKELKDEVGVNPKDYQDGVQLIVTGGGRYKEILFNKLERWVLFPSSYVW